MFYVIIFNSISYVILRLFLTSLEICFIFTERSTILDYISGSLGGSLTPTIFIRFYYISDDGYFGPMACSNRYFELLELSMSHHVCNLTKNFVSMFEVLLLCWHYFEGAFIFFVNAGAYVYYFKITWKHWTKSETKN